MFVDFIVRDFEDIEDVDDWPEGPGRDHFLESMRQLGEQARRLENALTGTPDDEDTA